MAAAKAVAAQAMQVAEVKFKAAAEARKAKAAMEARLLKERAILEEEHESKLCLICMDWPKCVIALPCGHGLACRECSEARLEGQLKQSGGLACLVCRAPVASLHVVFI